MIETVYRPTEIDALLSMEVGYVVTTISDVSNNFSGTDRAAYSKPNTTEREQMLERGFKWCSGTDGIHPPQYVPIIDFWRNRTRKDGYDHMCKHCRAAWNAKAA
jgi:hypothetical protein